MEGSWGADTLTYEDCAGKHGRLVRWYRKRDRDLEDKLKQ